MALAQQQVASQVPSYGGDGLLTQAPRNVSELIYLGSHGGAERLSKVCQSLTLPFVPSHPLRRRCHQSTEPL